MKTEENLERAEELRVTSGESFRARGSAIDLGEKC